MKYRKKPIVIEAFRYYGITEKSDLPVLAKEAISKYKIKPFSKYGGIVRWVDIETLEGIMRAEIGDYIIKGVKGKFYPCKPDIFEATYEIIEGN